MFQYLLSFSQGHLSSLLEGTYPSMSRQALPHVNQLFSSLSLYLRGANVSVEASIHQFFNNLFPLVYTRLINPGLEGNVMMGSEMDDCLRMIRQDVNPFGPHPAVMVQELEGALGAGRHLGLALEEGLEVMNATEHVGMSKECVKGLVKMVYCSHCRGLTLIKPCVGYCLNVMRGCLASVSELDQPWRRYTSLLEQLTHAMAGQHSLELALLGVRGHVNEALLYAQLHGPLVTATVSTQEFRSFNGTCKKGLQAFWFDLFVLFTCRANIQCIDWKGFAGCVWVTGCVFFHHQQRALHTAVMFAQCLNYSEKSHIYSKKKTAAFKDTQAEPRLDKDFPKWQHTVIV
ncbi:Glypican-5 [Liparis tanakae]|uniref:Glypican-5 n=1 Tax=Liparis tanakae TaxID=230148 RepID=A0A4Z2EDF1_9TELE|nr:Glypican-5 [Liparis tanakae]